MSTASTESVQSDMSKLDCDSSDCYHNGFLQASRKFYKHLFMTVRIFVADDVSDSGLQPLRDAGFEVDKRIKLPPTELLEAVAEPEGLIVRSETKVSAAVMDAARKLKVIGRAGVGVDNIDVAAATERGIVVMNAPDGNTI